MNVPSKATVIRSSTRREPFQLPRELVPIADHTGIRALGSSRPLAGGKEPRLHAWVRIDGLSDPLVQLPAQ